VKHNKEKKIERALRLTWDSLQSHLEYTYKKSWEGKQFHKKAVKDYSEIISILSELL
jgi:hypothetical protein